MSNGPSFMWKLSLIKAWVQMCHPLQRPGPQAEFVTSKYRHVMHCFRPTAEGKGGFQESISTADPSLPLPPPVTLPHPLITPNYNPNHPLYPERRRA